MTKAPASPVTGRQMMDMTGMTTPDEPNAITIAGDETKDHLAVHRSRSGLIGCHQPGHYEGGKGSISMQA